MCANQADEERLAGLFREVSQAVKLTVVATSEKSAEAIVGKVPKWVMLKGRTRHQMYAYGIPDSRKGKT